MNICSVILVLFLSFFSGTTSYKADGKASFYADRMHGRATASGEHYDKTQYTAAHASLPFNTYVLVTNLKNGKSVVVKINDRMARSRHHIIDLSRAAAKEIGIVQAGWGTVRITEITEKSGQQVLPVAVSETATTSKH